MDSNAALIEILTKAIEIIVQQDLTSEQKAEKGEELAYQIKDLHSWLRCGGFLPELWIKST